MLKLVLVSEHVFHANTYRPTLVRGDALTACLHSRFPSWTLIEKALFQKDGLRLVLLLRLSPVLPDSIMNYALALTCMRLRLFALATALAMLPYTLLYTYVGSTSNNIIKTIQEGGKLGDARGQLAVVVVAGSLAIIAVLYVGLALKQALRAVAREEGMDGGEGGGGDEDPAFLRPAEEVPLLAQTACQQLSAGPQALGKVLGIMNYALALTCMRLRLFALATALAMLPYTLLYTYVGSTSNNIIKTIQEGGKLGDARGQLAVVVVAGSLAIIAVLYVGLALKQALRAVAREEGMDGGEGGGGDEDPAFLRPAEEVPLLAQTACQQLSAGPHALGKVSG
ncbi:hypothetical protein QJQ45_016789 [Haematococcus lacustris]|nr:hypothetical protein QJQ45_016789 [Haematococcus lacustris]